MLEYFVHLDQDDPPDDLVLAAAEIPDDLKRERIALEHLIANWRDSAAPSQLARFGDEFAQRRESCLLLVPSALVPSENNCLINPEHSDFNRIVIHELERLKYDPRMFRRQRRRRLP